MACVCGDTEVWLTWLTLHIVTEIPQIPLQCLKGKPDSHFISVLQNSHKIITQGSNEAFPTAAIYYKAVYESNRATLYSSILLKTNRIKAKAALPHVQ